MTLRNSISIFDNQAFDNHEQVIFCSDSETGLNAIIAVHDTTLGPALGGTRMWKYDSDVDALEDVLRLARTMTLKNALAGVAYGGAKAVIVGDSNLNKNRALLKSYARHVNRLGGSFITGVDVGISSQDADIMAEVSPYIRGTSQGKVGDPSAYTALGVLKGIEAAVNYKLGIPDLKGVTVCVQGLGNVGMRLCRLLHRAGALLTVSDIRETAVRHARQQFDAHVIKPELAHSADVQVFAPCALGGILNSHTIPEIRAAIIAGAANTQLDTDADGIELRQRGILFAPDIVINAGGVLSVAHDNLGFDHARLRRDVSKIPHTLRGIFERADAEAMPTSVIASRIAKERLSGARHSTAA